MLANIRADIIPGPPARLIKPKKVVRVLLGPVSDRARWWRGEDTGHSRARFTTS